MHPTTYYTLLYCHTVDLAMVVRVDQWVVKDIWRRGRISIPLDKLIPRICYRISFRHINMMAIRSEKVSTQHVSCSINRIHHKTRTGFIRSPSTGRLKFCLHMILTWYEFCVLLYSLVGFDETKTKVSCFFLFFYNAQTSFSCFVLSIFQ